MENELASIMNQSIQGFSDMQFLPSLVEDAPDMTYGVKLPLSKLPALGTAFEPLVSAIQSAVNGSGTTTALYRVTIPKGTHLAAFRTGVGNMGTVLDANNQIAGQAILNPLVCNPATMFMAAALASVDQKLGDIQELQQEMMDYLVHKDRAELRGNLVFLSDLLHQFRFNWNNEMFKNSGHIKVLDTRQKAEQEIQFYRNQIE